MEAIKRLREFSNHKDAFTLLDRVMFRDISLNGLFIRILGIYFMDYKLDWVVKNHKHSFYELHYVVEHDVQTCLNGTEFCINEGSFYLMPPGTMHSHYQKNETGHIGFAIRWEILKGKNSSSIGTGHNDYRETKEMINFLSNIPLKIVSDDGTVLDGMFGVLEAAEKGRPDLCLKLALMKLVTDITEFYASSAPGRNVEVSRSFMDDNIVNTAIRFIEENYNQDIDVKDVAESTFLSYSHLSRIFKANTGESVNVYINKIRILKAQYLLKCSDMTIASVAAETGFKSENYFCDAFKKAVGASPLSYRKGCSMFSE